MEKMSKYRILVIALWGLGAGSIYATSAGLSGSGTDIDPFLIKSRVDFDVFCSNNVYWASGIHTRLDKDLDLAGTTYTNALIAPNMSTSSHYDGSMFSGVFDGNDHVIWNLTIDTAGADRNYLGLFGYMNGTSGRIENLGMEGGSVSGGASSMEVGALCGYNFRGTISGCYAAANVFGGEDVGGLCGYNGEGTISNSYAAGTVSAGDKPMYYQLGLLGGLVGFNDQGTINRCYATGAVTAGSEYLRLGGLCGKNRGVISDSYATGAVTGGVDSGLIGGLCGDMTVGKIRNCYAIGTVSGGTGAFLVDGLCGTNSPGVSTIIASFSGIGSEMQQQSTFIAAGWDFVNETANGTDDIWMMNGYPVLAGYWVNWVVKSDHGTPVPGIGTNLVAAGTLMTNSVNAVVEEGTAQYVCIGWNGGGATNAFIATAVADTEVVWNWATNYWLGAEVEGSGVVTVYGQTPWFAPITQGAFEAVGESVSLTATASPGQRFDHWEQNGQPIAGGKEIVITMDGAQTIMAVFVELSLAEILDAPGLSWSTGGDANWFAQTTDTSDGQDAAQSGATADEGNSWIETSVSGSGLLSFQWKVSSETNYDWLRLRVDGDVWRSISGENGWEQIFIRIEDAGAHILRWEYAKDKTMLDGDDFGMLDQVVWTPDYSNGFFQWAEQQGLVGDEAVLLGQDRNNDGVANAFEYAFGTNLLVGEVMLDVKMVNGDAVVEIPTCDAATQADIQILLLASTNMVDWTLPVVPASDATGKPLNREWFQAGAEYDSAFFKLQAELIQD